MKISDKLLNKGKPKLDPEIVTKSVSNIDILPEFENVYPLQWLFTYNSLVGKTYVYKLNAPFTPYLYAKIILSPGFKSYIIRLFSYISDVPLTEDNIDKVKKVDATLQYALSPDDLKLFGPNNPYGFTYELLINKLIDQYFELMRTR